MRIRSCNEGEKKLNIYGSQKVDKEGIPLRPIVNTIRSPTYHLAKYLEKKLRPLSGNMPSYIKDSSPYVQWIKNQKIKEEDIMVSFDIVCLYTNILVDEVINMIKDITNSQTAELVRICLKSTYFSYRGTIYA